MNAKKGLCRKVASVIFAAFLAGAMIPAYGFAGEQNQVAGTSADNSPDNTAALESASEKDVAAAEAKVQAAQRACEEAQGQVEAAEANLRTAQSALNAARQAYNSAVTESNAADAALSEAESALKAAQEATGMGEYNAALQARDAAEKELAAARTQAQQAESDLQVAANALSNAQQLAQKAAAAGITDSDYYRSLGSAGFLLWGGFADSYNLLMKRVADESYLTTLNGPGDATTLESLDAVVRGVTRINELRATEGLSPFGICPSLIAEEECRLNYGAINMAHKSWGDALTQLKVGSIGECLAWGHATPERAVDAWWSEKELYEQFIQENPEYAGLSRSEFSRSISEEFYSEIGHYLLLSDPGFSYVGFAWREHDYYRQAWGACMANRSACGMSVDEFEKLYAEYRDALEADQLLATAQNQYAAAQSAQSAAQTRVATAQTALQNAESALEKAQAAYEGELGVITSLKAQVEACRTAASAAQQKEDAAKIAYDAATSNVSAKQSQLDAANAAFSAAQVSLAQAQGELEALLNEGEHAAEVRRLWGDTALDTMAAITAAGFSDHSCSSIILATMNGYWDALTASGLAGTLGCPVLLTDGNALSDQTASEIVRLARSSGVDVYIAGGTAAISSTVEWQLTQMGCVKSRIRLAGDDAIDTSVKSYLTGSGWGDTCVVATAGGYWDALSASPFAYAKKAPIFLVEGGADSVRPEVLNAILSGGFSRVVIPGGEAAVSAGIVQQLGSWGLPVVRAHGDTAIETSDAMAFYCVQSGMTFKNVGIATSGGYYDALTAAAFCGKNNAPVLLVSDDERGVVTSTLASRASTIDAVYVFGGSFAVSDETYDAIVDSVRPAM